MLHICKLQVQRTVHVLFHIYLSFVEEWTDYLYMHMLFKQVGAMVKKRAASIDPIMMYTIICLWAESILSNQDQISALRLSLLCRRPSDFRLHRRAESIASFNPHLSQLLLDLIPSPLPLLDLS